MEVPQPLEKKHFDGGLYAVYMILPDEIDGTGWSRLWDWVFNHAYWTGKLSDSGENMNGLIEEHLNYFDWNVNKDFQQIDLLMPVKAR